MTAVSDHTQVVLRLELDHRSQQAACSIPTTVRFCTISTRVWPGACISKAAGDVDITVKLKKTQVSTILMQLNGAHAHS